MDDPSVEVSKVSLHWDFEHPGLMEDAPDKDNRVGTR